MTYLLATNDFPPKVGGIQNYLWELWRRLPEGSTAVYTTPYAGAVSFDAHQKYPVERHDKFFIGPTPKVRESIRRSASTNGANFVVFDPAFPLGAVGPSLGIPYGVILHGAEVTIPARLPGARQVMARTLRKADLWISASAWATGVASELCFAAAPTVAAPTVSVPTVYVPPGVDTHRFVPISAERRRQVRTDLGIDPAVPLILSVSRLVPRKGMDILIRAAAQLRRTRSLEVVIAGTGRDRKRLEKLVQKERAPVRFLGRVADEQLPDLYGAADVMTMLCRSRWLGLEQEGFGIVFLEAAAAATPQIAGKSGGAAEAVVDGETGFVVSDPHDVSMVVRSISRLLDDPELRQQLGAQGRQRACDEFDYSILAARLHQSITEAIGRT